VDRDSEVRAHHLTLAAVAANRRAPLVQEAAGLALDAPVEQLRPAKAFRRCPPRSRPSAPPAPGPSSSVVSGEPAGRARTASLVASSAARWGSPSSWTKTLTVPPPREPHAGRLLVADPVGRDARRSAGQHTPAPPRPSAPSTHPPVTDPSIRPLSSTSISAPRGRAAPSRPSRRVSRQRRAGPRRAIRAQRDANSEALHVKS